MLFDNSNLNARKMSKSPRSLEFRTNLWFQDSRLLSINEGRELILYGGRVAADIDAIWKYTVADSTWKQVWGQTSGPSLGLMVPSC